MKFFPREEEEEKGMGDEHDEEDLSQMLEQANEAQKFLLEFQENGGGGGQNGTTPTLYAIDEGRRDQTPPSTIRGGARSRHRGTTTQFDKQASPLSLDNAPRASSRDAPVLAAGVPNVVYATADDTKSSYIWIPITFVSLFGIVALVLLYNYTMHKNNKRRRRNAGL